jgi:hypothetical protein
MMEDEMDNNRLLLFSAPESSRGVSSVRQQNRFVPSGRK